MKKLTGLLLVSLWACAGCLGEQKYPMGMSTPFAHIWGGKPSPASPQEVNKPSPPKPVTPEEVNPATARTTADALGQELDRADAGEP